MSMRYRGAQIPPWSNGTCCLYRLTLPRCLPGRIPSVRTYSTQHQPSPPPPTNPVPQKDKGGVEVAKEYALAVLKHVGELGKQWGQKSAKTATATVNYWWERYEEFVGLNEVRDAQAKVNEAYLPCLHLCADWHRIIKCQGRTSFRGKESHFHITGGTAKCREAVVIAASEGLQLNLSLDQTAGCCAGATKEIGSALTRMCMRHRSIESKLKLFTTSLSDCLITPLELKIEEWKKVASQLDKDHAKEYKKARADIKKKSSDTVKLQKKVKKGKDEARGQLDSALQDVNVRYAVLEETEKRAVCRALIEERARYCSFVSMLKPVLDHEISMLGEVTHLQTILEDLTNLTADPTKLPPASEQVILDLKGSDFSYTYQTPPASPSNTLSRKSSISSNYQSSSVRHVPSLDSISCAVDGIHMQRCSSPYLLIGTDETGRSLSEGNSPSRHSRHGSRGRCGYVAGRAHPAPSRHISRREMTSDALGSTNQLAPWSGSGGGENGSLATPHIPYTHHGERARAMSASAKSCSAREQLALTLGVGRLNSDTQRSSRDSLHCSSGYSTQTTTPSCSEDTIHSHVDLESISLHCGEADSISLHHVHLHGNSQSDFDKSSTIPRNSDLSFQYKKLLQSKRPASTVSLLADGSQSELIGGSLRQSQSHTATIRRKPSSKPAYRRGTISGGVPIPICTPQVPLKALAGGGGGGGANSGSDENVFVIPSSGGGQVVVGGLGHSKLCTSTQSLSALPPSSSTSCSSSSSSPYYQLVPGQMPIPVPVPTVPSLPAEGGTAKQQHNNLQPQQQQGQLHTQQQQQQFINQQLNQQQQFQQQQLNTHQQHYQQSQQIQPQVSQQQLQQQLHRSLSQQPQTQQQHHHQQQYQQRQSVEQPNQLQQLQSHFKHPQQQLLSPQPQHQQYQQQIQYQEQQYQQHQKQLLHQPDHQSQPHHPVPAAQGEGAEVGHIAHNQPHAPFLTQNPNPGQLSKDEGGGADGGRGARDMANMIRGVKLRRTVTNDRSAPLLPPPTNHK
ncbi:protein MTSS 1 [Lampris incognitus]|uniref:protein MTSS 1 n=1 Tax=Lampris incognitus TaxID=2546036 RepID=UPI0024B52F95|nr:protein MTSS 1 [Lampris incognitus]